ncbi:MAG: S41 family peptidase [Elusimicrobiota bacterium]|jgi:carboxyl-terminal processing protease
MKKTLTACLSMLLLAGGAAAQLSYVPFTEIRGKALGRDAAAPGVGSAVPVKYRVENPPDGQSAPPPNLTEMQTDTLLVRLAGIMQAVDGKRSMTHAQAVRLMQGLITIDSKFVDPVSTARWNAILQDVGDVAEKEYSAEGRDWDVVIDHMLQKAIQDLREPHSAYMDPAQAKAAADSSNGTFTGIGVVVSPDAMGMRLDTLYPGSGAEAAGLLEGDVIAWVDGSSVSGLAVDDIVKVVRGEPGTVVKVKVLRDGKLGEPVPVTRSRIAIPNLFSRMAAPGIGYLYLRQFSPSVDEAVLAALRALREQGARALILDVRGNGGGRIAAVSSIASEFLKDKDLIVAFKHQGKTAFRNVTSGDGEFSGVPVAVLIDEKSASASEILSGALQDKRAGFTVIGSRSFGKGTEQVTLSQPGGRALKLTENRWFTPDDRSIAAENDPDGNELPGTGGIVPDLVVEVSSAQRVQVMKSILLDLFERPQNGPRPQDPVLEKAVEVLQ